MMKFDDVAGHAAGGTPQPAIPGLPEAPRIPEALDLYLEWCESKSKPNRPGTMTKKRHAAELLRDAWFPLRVDQLSPIHVDQFIRDRAKAGASPGTCNRDLAMIKHFVKMALRWGWIDGERAERLKSVEREQEPRRMIRWLSEDEEARILAVSPPSMKLVIMIALYTGLRRGELLRLKWSDIDLETRWLRVTKSKTYTGRQVPLSIRLVQFLREQPRRSEFVAVLEDGTRFRPDGVYSRWRRIRGKAGLPDVRFHDLRATFATRLHNMGVSPINIRDMLGHTDLATTLKYTRSSWSAMADAVDKL